MKPEARDAFHIIERADWFSAVGQPREGPFIILQSWDEAIEQCGSDEWDALTLEAANRYGEAVLRRDIERYRQWNTVAADVRQVVLPLVERRIRPLCAALGLPAIVESCIRWDLIHFGIECEFAEVFPPGFFADQIYWYTQGRFPCGWQGEFPEGKLVLY
ncbi:hypothetical protein [Hymenobacter psoromatis]|uniref:hypothetical protein n=1 Tax=Hymenobacter psoromatis TaxID=1484116 RepID=UPI001CBC852E|nr:hypothetical protein [Hymenobacter psoromatis]